MQEKKTKSQGRMRREEVFAQFEKRCEQFFGPIMRAHGLELTERVDYVLERCLTYSNDTLKMFVVFEHVSYLSVQVELKVGNKWRRQYMSTLCQFVSPDIEMYPPIKKHDVVKIGKTEFEFGWMPIIAKILKKHWDALISALANMKRWNERPPYRK